MRQLTLTAIALVFLSLAGCLPVRSLHPFYTDKDVVSEPQIVGTWFDSEDKESHSQVTFSAAGNQSYEMVISDPDRSTELKFVTHLFRLGNTLFLDALLDDFRVKGTDEGILGFAVPAHTIFQVKLTGDSLHLISLDDDWLKKALANKSVQIAHEDLGDGSILLTATPTALQQLIAAYAGDKSAFNIDSNLTRRKP
jgi:hypothetical protein